MSTQNDGKEPVDPREEHGMRLLFATYIGVVVIGLVFFMVIGLSHH